MKIEFLNNFFRKDLNLKDKWWHRLLSVVFIVAFFALIAFNILSLLSSPELQRYSKVGMLSDRTDSEVRLIGSLVSPEEKIAVYENNLYGSDYEHNGGWLLEQEYYCSKNISTKVEEIATKTGVNTYKGNLNLVSLDEFKNYLLQNNANCIQVLNLDNVERFGSAKKVLCWGFEADDMAVWQVSPKKSIMETIFSVIQDIFSAVFWFLIILVLYYKVFIYIVFGSKKSNSLEK